MEILQLNFPCAAADWAGFNQVQESQHCNHSNFPENLNMDSDPVTQTKKRTLGQMLTADLLGKLKSKQDFFVYLDKHGK